MGLIEVSLGLNILLRVLRYAMIIIPSLARKDKAYDSQYDNALSS